MHLAAAGSEMQQMRLACGSCLLFVAVAVARHELINTTGGVNEFLLAGEEGVRAGGDFELHEGVFNAVDNDGFFGGNSAASDEYFFVGHVLESHFAVVGRMEVFFHILLLFSQLGVK